MEQGNTVAEPAPVNEAPGLNAIWVYGQNMQAAVGLNHQVAIGTNQQICINPLGLTAGLGTETVFSALLGSGLGGNMQLTLGTNVALTAGQAYEINLGPDKVDVHGSRKTHISTFLISGALGTLAVLYAIGYGTAAKGLNYVQCGTYTTLYQLAVDACLAAIMKVEADIHAHNLISIKEYHDDHGTKPDPPQYDPDEPSSTSESLGVLSYLGSSVGLIAAVAETLAPASDSSREESEESDAHTKVCANGQ